MISARAPRPERAFSLHPSVQLLEQWTQLTSRVHRLASSQFGGAAAEDPSEYYFGESYLSAQSIPPMEVLAEPLKLAGGLRVLVHGDPTFMVMDNLKRQFEQVIGDQDSSAGLFH